MPSEADYFGMGLRAIRHFLSTELAGPWREIEARVADDVYPGLSYRIQPHILSRVRGYLRREGEIDEIKHKTHGERVVDLIISTDPHIRKRDLTSAIGHKAKLYGRYQSWAQGPLTTDYPSGVIGLAGERVLSDSVRSPRLTGSGFAIDQPPGQVAHLLGHRVVGGAYDDAAYLIDTGSGVARAILLPFEMKNGRGWLYSDNDEVHKFLYRSACLQQRSPDQLICPIIVSRKRHNTLYKMGIDLGFYSIGLGLQFVLPVARVDVRKFEEVRLGLNFMDLVLQDRASPRLVKILDTSVRRDALKTALRWRDRGSTFLDAYDNLRSDLSGPARDQRMGELRTEASQGPLDHQGGW